MTLLAGARAVVFDLDGVLWHSQQAHHEAYRQVLSAAGLDVPAYAELAGRKTSEVIRALLLGHGLPAESERVAGLTRAKQEAARALLRERPPVAPSAPRVLEALSARFALGLATSASAGSVTLFLEATQTRKLFRAVVTGDDVANAKPAPDVYRVALERLGVAPAEAVVVEDAVSGIRAARTAGVRVVAVTGTSSREELAKEDVGHVIDGLEELLG